MKLRQRTSMFHRMVCAENMDCQLISPVFNKVTIALDQTYSPGKTIVIENKNAKSGNHYIRSMEPNRKQIEKPFISYQKVRNAGGLHFEMTIR
jgi:putative alpha-1,2-mannosidase